MSTCASSPPASRPSCMISSPAATMPPTRTASRPPSRPTTTVLRSASAGSCGAGQLGHPLSERSPPRWRMRRHFPAAGVAPCQGGGAPGPALGRNANHALVREAPAARRQRLTKPCGLRRTSRRSAGDVRLLTASDRRGGTIVDGRPLLAHAPSRSRLLPFPRRIARPRGYRRDRPPSALEAGAGSPPHRAAERLRHPHRHRVPGRSVRDGSTARLARRARRAGLPGEPEAAGQGRARPPADHERVRPSSRHLSPPGARPPRRTLERARLDVDRGAGGGIERALALRRLSRRRPRLERHRAGGRCADGRGDRLSGRAGRHRRDPRRRRPADRSGRASLERRRSPDACVGRRARRPAAAARRRRTASPS